MGMIKVNRLKEQIGIEQLHINFSRKTAKGLFGAVRFVDKDTKQHVIYLQALDITGYGETQEKAWQMLRFCLNDYFKHLFTLSAKTAAETLIHLGWEKSRLFQKEFSRAYIDSNGDLQNLNAEENTIERVSLTAA